jgi:hypothetical protein
MIAPAAVRISAVASLTRNQQVLLATRLAGCL